MTTAQLDLPGTAVIGPTAPHGYTRPRTQGARPRAVTSLELSLEERELLGCLARAEAISLGEVLRRGLALYAARPAKGPEAPM